MRWSRKAMRLETESVYGTDAEPADGDAVLFIASDVNLTPLAYSTVEREVVRDAGQFGSYAQQLFGKHVMLEFSVELAGSGDVDTPPGYAKALLACALAETINADTSVVYSLVSDEASHDSCTIYFDNDGKLYQLLGARGNPVWNFAPGQRPTLRFSMLGIFAAVTDATFPSPDFSAYQAPMLVSDANTPTLSLHGASVVGASVSINLGNVVEYRELVNAQEVVITDRRPSGSITFEDALVATKDWFGIVTAETQAAFQIVHGVGAGNICQLDAPKVQLLNPRLGGSQNRSMLTLDLNLVPNSADDELVFTTK